MVVCQYDKSNILKNSCNSITLSVILNTVGGGKVMAKVVIKVSELMGRHRINQRELTALTGIRPGTVSQLWHGTTKRIEIEQIGKLCQVLKCQPGDLFEYVSDEK